MRKLWPEIVGAILGFALTVGILSHAQTKPVTQPTTQRVTTCDVYSFFQPKRNLQMLHDQGIRVHVGPEVENANALAPDALLKAQSEWYLEVGRLGDRAIAKRPPPVLPKCVVGVMVIYDEPNGKSIPPSAVQAEADKLRTAYPGVPVWLSLAGDKITSANFTRQNELDLFLGYANAADVLTVDVYSMNRNANRYLPTWTADCVRKVKLFAPKKRVVPWIEMNDQRLSPPAPPFVNRAPTPEEIEQTVEAALDAGADGFGWFSTCDSGKYGWGFAGDSFWPLVDRNGVSLAPQLAKVRSLSLKYSPVLPTPPPEDPAVTALKAENAALKTENQSLHGKIDKVKAALEE